MKNKQTKYILKKAIQKYLPISVINHFQQGFTLSFEKSLKEYVYDRLNSRNSLLSIYLDMNVLRKTVKDHDERKSDLNDKIWSLLFFDVWLSKHQNANT